eukprot:4729849-Amphidinium_carterae.2
MASEAYLRATVKDSSTLILACVTCFARNFLRNSVTSSFNRQRASDDRDFESPKELVAYRGLLGLGETPPFDEWEGYNRQRETDQQQDAQPNWDDLLAQTGFIHNTTCTNWIQPQHNL